jgi:uncharacterized protein with beta-barrel porin domain
MGAEMKISLWKLGLWIIFVTIMAPMHLNAACQIVGFTMDGFIVVCDGPDTIGVASGVGSDIITINIGAQVSKTDIVAGSPAPPANAVVINAGSGNNEIINRGRIEGNASESESISLNVAYPAGWVTATASAYANSAGIVSLDGADVITNSVTGTIVVNAVATANAEVDIDLDLSGDNQNNGDAFSGAQASAVGIDAGSGPNRVTNEGSITVNATAIAIAEADSDWANGPDDRITIAGEWSPAKAMGIVTGAGDDVITNTNTGAIDVTATINIDLTSDIWGVPDVKAEARNDFYPYSIAEAVGINAGDGANVITNNGTINVNATANIEVETDAVLINPIAEDSPPVSLAETTVTANATGIVAGNGNNTISNSGSINVSATADGKSDADGDSASTQSAATSTSTLNLIANATGISVGNGNNMIDNEGTITVRALSVPVLTSEDAYAESTEHGYANLTRTANATGIIAGNGTNEIDNQGSIDVGATAEGNSHANTNSTWTTNDAHATTNLTANAIGIAVGNGSNSIDNSGSIRVTAKILTGSADDSVGWAYEAYGRGDEDGDGTSTLTANATGIRAGDGNNVINNDGTIMVQAVTEKAVPGASVASADARANAFWHATRSDAVSTAIGNATGISVGDGTNEVNNRGDMEVDAHMTASGYAYADSASEQATAVVITASTANATGISAGAGDNTITNDATIKVKATANAVGQADAWTDSSLYNGTANTTSTSTAIATGIRAEGGPDAKNAIQNSTLGNITVESRAEGSAYAGNGEYATAATTLMATAMGISAGQGENLIYNYGYMEVNAVAGRDENGNPTVIADADTSTSTTSNYAASTGSSTAIATGILAGDGTNFISNQGTIIVNGTGHAMVSKTEAFSRDQNPHADVHSNAAATVVGISTGGGFNEIRNSGLLDVDAWTMAYAQGWADSWSDYTYTNVDAGSIGEATGIKAGDGSNTIYNEVSGNISVNSAANVDIFSSSDENANAFTGINNNTLVKAKSMGIEVGEGDNVITNQGQITVGSAVNANSHAYASSVTFTATAIAKTGGSAEATGIKTGDGNNTIRNDGPLIVTATNKGKALSDFPTAHLDWASAYAGAGGTSMTSDATGILAGNGVNVIESHNTILVTSTVDANAQAYANTSTSTNHGEAYAGGIAIAKGIITGDGQNTIKSYDNMTVTATAGAFALGHAEDYGYAYIGSESAPGVITEAIGISAGTGLNEVSNYGTLEVNATATAYSKGRAHTTSVDAHGRAIANSYATAIGIRTGDGTNIVTNYGTINVSATGSATAETDVWSANEDEFRYTYQYTNASAIGIQTGAGDDFIANYGTIITTTMKNGVAGLGIAITSGAGNDQVFLMSGSTTTGSIDLGDGDDWLTFVGTPIVTGNITGANGIDTLVFDGAGSIGITPMAFENAIKQGAGTFTVAGLPTMQRIEIRQGALQVNNNYQFSNSGFFQTFVNGNGSFGQFKVNGTTNLAGDLNVLKGPGPFLNGTTYNIIEANAVNNVFSNVTLPPPNNFVSFRMNQFPTIVQIEVYAKDFTWLVRNRVEWAVANYLDRILPSATGGLLGMLGQIQNLSQSEFYKALSTLSPDSFDNFTRTTYSTAHRYNKSLQYRMNNVRSHLHVSQPGNETPILLAYRGSDVGQLYSSGRVSQIQGKNGLWLDAFGQWGDQGEEYKYRWNDGYTGYDYFMRGATLGFDHNLTDKFFAGVSAGYSRADVDLDHHQGSGYIKSLYGSIYGSYFYKNLYIDGIFSYGKNWYDNHRLITIGTDQRKAYSKHDGNLFSAYLQGGYYFDIKKWLIGPFVSLQYIYLDEEGFNEKGADGVSLRIDSRQTNSLVSELGLRVARVFKTKYGSLIPEVSAAWLHDFDIDDRMITSSFTGSPGASFSIKGQDVERNGATLGAGITFVHKSGLSTSLKYIGEFREKYKSNGIMGELRFTF